ncbi:hypothetical protein SAMN04487890_12242 [Mucilaginibacter polytrichastri]|nr:hypothetical protein SAMN04487890_12242 [Mucilaginibacter polytrichastri]
MSFVFVLFMVAGGVSAQPKIQVVDGLISLDDFSPTEKKYALLTDSLDKKLMSDPKDTTSLFYRALLYLQFNSFVVKPDLGSNVATDHLIAARKMADMADSLQMKSFNLKVLKAQICKELTNRYAPIEVWRFNAAQLAARKKKFDYYKGLANREYAELETIDKGNAYAYHRLMVK